MIEAWRRLHRGPAWLRWPLKWLVLALVVVLALYPRFWLLPTALDRLAHLNALIDPDHPGLAPLEAAARAAAPADADPATTLAVVERTIYASVPYSYDWDNYGVMFYIPTVDEALARGTEDCDGRAVLAASLLRRMGFEASLVSDYMHMWVETPQGATMSPGRGKASFESTDPSRTRKPGSRFKIDTTAVLNLGRGTTFGIAVFPLVRLIIILAAVFLLTLHPRTRAGSAALAAVLFAAALTLVRILGEGLSRGPAVAPVMALSCATLILLGLAWWLVARRGVSQFTSRHIGVKSGP